MIRTIICPCYIGKKYSPGCYGKVLKGHSRVEVKFWCCDLCGKGFGVTKYPDGDFVQPEKTPTKVLNEKGKIFEICKRCANRYKKVGHKFNSFTEFIEAEKIKAMEPIFEGWGGEQDEELIVTIRL